MADRAIVESMADKFQEWAQSLSDHEQATLAEWIAMRDGEEVQAHRADWWRAPNAWADVWSQSWSW